MLPTVTFRCCLVVSVGAVVRYLAVSVEVLVCCLAIWMCVVIRDLAVSVEVLVCGSAFGWARRSVI